MFDAERRKYWAVASLVAIVLILLVIVLFAFIEQRDPEQFLAPVAGYLTPTIATLIAILGVYKKQDDASQDMKEVKRNVNGNLSDVQSQLKAVQAMNTRLLAVLTPDQINAVLGKDGEKK